VAFWPCSGDVRDESGNGNDGILKNGADFGADRFGVAEHACRFDGIDDIVDIGANVKPSFPVTLSTWINVDTLGANRGVFRSDMWDPNAFYHGFHATVGSTGHVGTGVGSGFASASTRRQFSTDDAVISIGVWHHLAIIYNSPNDMRVFVDGVAHPGTYSGNGGSMTYSSASGAIGHRGLDWMDGRIDDTRVYSRALSEEEIQALASDGP